jgi:hypothetical protein
LVFWRDGQILQTCTAVTPPTVNSDRQKNDIPEEYEYVFKAVKYFASVYSQLTSEKRKTKNHSK